jgi:hypothetical protein
MGVASTGPLPREEGRERTERPRGTEVESLHLLPCPDHPHEQGTPGPASSGRCVAPFQTENGGPVRLSGHGPVQPGGVRA